MTYNLAQLEGYVVRAPRVTSLEISNKLFLFFFFFAQKFFTITRLPAKISILLREYRPQFFQETPSSSFFPDGRSYGLFGVGEQNKIQQ